MKKILLFSVIMLVALATHAQKDSVTIFRPTPGHNDSTDQGGANGGKDAYVYQYTPDQNYDSGIIVALPVSNCNNTQANGYLQFDVSGLPSNPDSVFLEVTHIPDTTYCYSNCDAYFYIANVTQQWHENTITFNNKPSQDTTHFFGPIHITFPNNFGPRAYNITAIYNKWRNGVVPNYGMVFYSPTVGCNNAAVGFFIHSSDDTDANTRPYLKIHTTVPNFVQTPLAQELNLKVYPNPVNQNVNISFIIPFISNAKIVITDIVGKVVFEKEVNDVTDKNITINIPMQNYATGLYMLNLYTSKGSVSGKIIKQ